MNTIRLFGNKPSWLGMWPNMAALNYPQTMRVLALRLLNTETALSIHLTEKSLTAVIGMHKCVWTLLPNNTWKRTCTCHYINDKCVHSYAAYLMLRQVCTEMEWAFPQGNITAPQIYTNYAPTRPIAPRPQQQPPQHTSPTNQLSFFNDFEANHRTPSTQQAGYRPTQVQRPPISRPAVPQPPVAQIARLEVEIEFIPNYSGMKARFYFNINDRRNLMDLAKVRYEASRINADRTAGSKTTQYIWSKEDADFLIWLMPQLSTKQIPGRVQTLLPIPPAEREIWLDKWSAVPGRLIEKSTQKPFNPLNLHKLVSLHFEMTRQGENLRVYPVIMAEDGARHFVHKLIPAIREDVTGYTRKLVSSFKPAVPWEHLIKYYSNGPINIQYSDAARQLPVLIQSRFDLIRNSENAVEISEKNPNIGLEASTDNHGNFVLTPIVDGRRTTINQGIIQAVPIHFVEGKLHINTYSEDALGKINAIINDATHILPDAKHSQTAITIPANSNSAEKLITYWNMLPEGIQKITTRSTAGLFSQQQTNTSVEISLRDRGNFTDLSFNCTCNGSIIPERAYRNNPNCNGIFQNATGNWMHFNYDKIVAAMQTLAEEGFDGRKTTILKQNTNTIIEKLEENENIRVADNSLLLMESIRSQTPPPQLQINQKLNTILRSYQKIGCDFLLERLRYGVGSILADDMGLGKTLQILAAIDACKTRFDEQQQQFRALVVCPASVIDVWLKQTEQFCPWLKATGLRGTKTTRQRIIANETSPIIVTHYGLVRADIDELSKTEFAMVVLDEAQAIKNPNTAATKAVLKLKSQRRLALTGTPLENNLGDLWSILNFLNPGTMGDVLDFQTAFANGERNHIARTLQLLMLRRSKTLVAPELPAKTEETIRLEMDDTFENLYAREFAKAKMSSANADMVTILSLYTKLRLLCCAPELVMKDEPEMAPPSIKIEFLKEKLQELTDAGHSVLVFSQFTSMLAIIDRELTALGIKFFTITGETPIPKRAQIVDDFNASEQPAVFLLSLKAAGTGLTLTKADYVFLMDPWWNPAVENQAIDRTHRIGQDKPVFAYRIIMADSIEERVLNIIQYKRELFNAVIDGVDTSNTSTLTAEELRSLLK